MNPEIQFRNKYKPDYSGMMLAELPFCKLEDHAGIPQTYRLDLITSIERPDRPIPVVLFVHGGGFTQPCDKRQAYISTFARSLTKAGYAVVSPDYPIFDNKEQLNAAGGEAAGYAKAGEAVHLAYQYVVEHAVEMKVDPARIAIIGGSAGGWAAFYGIGNYSDHYCAFINLWGAPEQIPNLAGFPPTLSVHGKADTLVPFQREIHVQERLAACGIDHCLISLDGSGHTPLNRMGDFLPQMMALLGKVLS